MNSRTLNHLQIHLVIGNIGRYLNHSCDPNLSLVTVGSSCMVPHIALFTNRAVAEVTGVGISVTIIALTLIISAVPSCDINMNNLNFSKP